MISSTIPQLSAKELKVYSIVAALQNAGVRRFGRTSTFETEFSDQLTRTWPGVPMSGEGVWIPYQVLAQRTLNTSTGSSGAFTVSDRRTPAEPFVFPQSRIYQAGATDFTGLQPDPQTGALGNFSVPAFSTSSEAEWLSEIGAASSSKDSGFRAVGATPRRLVCQRIIGKQFLMQLSEKVDAFLSDLLTSPLAAAIDRAALAGTGGVQPVGVLNTASVTDVAMGSDGAAPTLAKLNDIEHGVISSNFRAEAASYIISAAARRKCKNTPKAASTSSYLLESISGRDWLNGHPCFSTSYMPDSGAKGSGTALGSVVYGDFSKMAIVSWVALHLVSDPYTQAGAGKVVLTITGFIDLLIIQPTAFSKSTDLVCT